MSLIIARKINKKFAIFSDTLISLKQGEGNEDKHFVFKHYPDKDKSVIKSVIVNPQLVICFAGDNYFAEMAFKAISNENSSEKIVEILTQFHRESKNQTDFILCFGQPTFELIVIKEGEISSTNSTWIGDKEAFNVYQSYFHDEQKRNQNNQLLTSLKAERLPEGYNEEEVGTFLKMKKSMICVIEDSKIKSVGGFVIPIAYEEGRFHYIDYMYNFRKPIEEHEVEIGWGTAADGGFSTNFIGSDKSTIGLHFFQGNIGVVYEREEKGLVYPKVYADMDEIDFFEFLKTKKNVNPSIMAKHNKEDLAIKGVTFLQNANPEMAIHFLNWAMKVSSRNWGKNEDGTNEFLYLEEYLKQRGAISLSISDADTVKKIAFHRGNAHENKGQFELAIRNYKESLSIDPNFLLPLQRIGIVLGKQGKFPDSLCIFNKCINIHNDYESYYNRGILFAQIEEFSKAKNDIELSLKLNSDNPIALDALKKLNQNSDQY